MVIAWRSVVDGCVLICLLCRVFFKVRANRRVGKSKDPKTRVPEIAVPDLVRRKNGEQRQNGEQETNDCMACEMGAIEY